MFMSPAMSADVTAPRVSQRRRSCLSAGPDGSVRHGSAEQQPSAALATGLVGVAAGQELNLHVTRLIPPEPVLPPEPIHVLVSLVDDSGSTLSQTELVLGPGRSGTIQLKGPSFGSRMLVRAGRRAPSLGTHVPMARAASNAPVRPAERPRWAHSLP
jgi:hypothetical protein